MELGKYIKAKRSMLRRKGGLNTVIPARYEVGDPNFDYRVGEQSYAGGGAVKKIIKRILSPDDLRQLGKKEGIPKEDIEKFLSGEYGFLKRAQARGVVQRDKEGNIFVKDTYSKKYDPIRKQMKKEMFDKMMGEYELEQLKKSGRKPNADGGVVQREAFYDGGLAPEIQQFVRDSFPEANLQFEPGKKYGVSKIENPKLYKNIEYAVSEKLKKGKDYKYFPKDVDFSKLEYEPGFGSKEQFIQKAREKGITIKEPKSFAKTHDVESKVSPYQKSGQDKIYDLTVLDNPEFVENVIKKQIKSGTSKNPEVIEKYKPEIEKKSAEEELRKQRRRYKEERKQKGVPGFKSAPKTSGVEKSHIGDIFSQTITGENVGYAPREINKMLADKKGIEEQIRKLYVKQRKLVKQNPANLAEELEKINLQLAELEAMAQGYKNVVFVDPKTGKKISFGGGRFSLDATNQFLGMTEKEIRDFRNKYLNEKGQVKKRFLDKDGNFVGTLDDFENLQKAVLYDMNTKEVLDAVKSQKGTLTEKFVKDLKKIKPQNATNLLSLVPGGKCRSTYSDGGPVKFSNKSNCFLRGKEILNKAKAGDPSALSQVRKFFKTPAAKFGLGALIELGIEGLFAVESIAEGKPFDQVLGESFLSIFGLGSTEDQQVLKHAAPEDIEDTRKFIKKMQNEDVLNQNIAFEETVQPETGEESTEDFFTVESLRPAMDKQRKQLEKDSLDPDLEKQQDAYVRSFMRLQEANKKRAEEQGYRKPFQYIKEEIYDPTGKKIMEAYEGIKDLFAEGGRVGMSEGGDPKDKMKTPFDKPTLPLDPNQIPQVQNPSRRGFIKGAGFIGAGIAAFAAGLLRLGRKESAKKLVQKAATYGGRRIDGVPEIISDLIQTIKLKGQVIDAPKPGSGPVVYKYNKYEYVEDINGFTINKVNDRGNYGYSEEVFQFEKDPETGAVFFDDITVKPDGDGKLKDVEYGVDYDSYNEIADDLAKFNHNHPNDTRFRDKARKFIDEERLKNEGIEPKPGTELD